MFHKLSNNRNNCRFKNINSKLNDQIILYYNKLILNKFYLNNFNIPKYILNINAKVFIIFNIVKSISLFL